MKHQLIVTILGSDRVGILSALASAVSEAGCNILDSRQAIYGQDFSLTMILEGTQSSITKAELKLPMVCQQLDLLSMMKRTQKHSKQNLKHMVDIKLSGVDTVGVMQKVTSFLAQFDIAVNAFRQKTYTNKETQQEMMQCKMVASVPDGIELTDVNLAFQTLLDALGLQGQISEKY
ncbi:glycine cleavage system transcriptional repressor [Aestuariibacter sp. AA17]|uniref:Glycine cleavage system transcriptional repressor n=1 Tax=Fluctibacter corallii TaxID=2984329 RepID=A0ABT3A652_9ALTE|nr:ACT domain-containing protein [Aestuariibacter sp. AA17]MCV2884049.1 glycine cleavage system transcriptional repressor [Aestuariibacter sp. AA17]